MGECEAGVELGLCRTGRKPVASRSQQRLVETFALDKLSGRIESDLSNDAAGDRASRGGNDGLGDRLSVGQRIGGTKRGADARPNPGYERRDHSREANRLAHVGNARLGGLLRSLDHVLAANHGAADLDHRAKQRRARQPVERAHEDVLTS